MLSITLVGAVVVHTVFAQHQTPSHGPDVHAEHMRAMQGMTGRRAPLAQIMRLATPCTADSFGKQSFSTFLFESLSLISHGKLREWIVLPISSF
jgi:hypothetical protein